MRSRAPRSHASLAARHAGDGVGDAWAYARLIRARRCRLGRAAALPSPGVLCTARRPVRGREVSSGAKAPMSAPSLCVAATPSSSKPNPLTVSATPAQSSPHYCTLRVRSWTPPARSLSPAGASRPQPAVSLNCTLLFRHCALLASTHLMRRLRILTSPLVRRRRSDDLERSGSSSPTTPRDPHTSSSRRPPAQTAEGRRRFASRRRTADAGLARPKESLLTGILVQRCKPGDTADAPASAYSAVIGIRSTVTTRRWSTARCAPRRGAEFPISKVGAGQVFAEFHHQGRQSKKEYTLK